MEIKLITTNVTTSGGGIGFKFIGNVDVAKPKPLLRGTTVNPKQSIKFHANKNVTITSNDEKQFEYFSDEPLTKFMMVGNLDENGYPIPPDFSEDTGMPIPNIESLDLSNMDTSHITDMSYMFVGLSGITSLDLSNFDTSNVTTMYGLFYLPNSLTSINVSSFDTSKVTMMGFTFSYCSNLNSLDVSNFNTSKVICMGSMFLGCSNLTSLNLSNFDTSQVVEGMDYMFAECGNLESLDLSNFIIQDKCNLSNMFYNCASLRTIKVINETTANKLIAQIQTDLKKTATWDSTTKIITIPAA